MSSVYLAVGYVNGLDVMKIGETNHWKARQKQIGIQIIGVRQCATSDAALSLEGEIRRFAIRYGGILLSGKKDWFHYDLEVAEFIAEVYFKDDAVARLAAIEAFNKELCQRLEAENAELRRRIDEINDEHKKRTMQREKQHLAEIGDLRETIGFYKGILLFHGIKFEE